MNQLITQPRVTGCVKIRSIRELALQRLLLLPMGLWAQTPAPPYQLDSGTVVRLQLHSGVREKGKLLSPYAQDSSRIRYCHYPAPSCRVGDERYRDQPSEPTNVEVRRGTAWLPGLVIGGLAGAAFGALVIQFSEDLGETPLSTGENFRAIAGGTLIFGGLGALVGSAFERWGSP